MSIVVAIDSREFGVEQSLTSLQVSFWGWRACRRFASWIGMMKFGRWFGAEEWSEMSCETERSGTGRE